MNAISRNNTRISQQYSTIPTSILSSGRPAAMILFSDGIYNTGVNPEIQNTGFPVYTVALGDTVAYPDVYIRNVETDKFNFVNTIFPIKVEVGAIKQKGSQVKCSLKQNDQVIARQILTIGQDYFFQEVSFEVEAPKKEYSGIVSNWKTIGWNVLMKTTG